MPTNTQHPDTPEDLCRMMRGHLDIDDAERFIVDLLRIRKSWPTEVRDELSSLIRTPLRASYEQEQREHDESYLRSLGYEEARERQRAQEEKEEIGRVPVICHG